MRMQLVSQSSDVSDRSRSNAVVELGSGNDRKDRPPVVQPGVGTSAEAGAGRNARRRPQCCRQLPPTPPMLWVAAVAGAIRSKVGRTAQHMVV